MISNICHILKADVNALFRALFVPIRRSKDALAALRITITLFFILVPLADLLGSVSYGYQGWKLYGDFIGYTMLCIATYKYRSVLFAIFLILADFSDLYLMSQKLQIGLVSWSFLITIYLPLRILYLTCRFRVLSKFSSEHATT